MSQQDIVKKCADSLRTYSKNNYETKLKAAHAHELVAAFFGYSSKNSLLADTNLSIANLPKADVIVMMPDSFIENRRKDLMNLSTDLPNSYDLGEGFYTALFEDEKIYTSEYPPFRNFEKLGLHFVKNSQHWKSVFPFLANVDLEHLVEIEEDENVVRLKIIHTVRVSDEELSGVGQTTLTLIRVAGRIGFSRPVAEIGTWTGGARKTYKVSKGGV